MTLDDGIRWLADQIKKGGVVIFSGAGLSTESGLKDFRSRDGHWAKFDPAKLASVDALERNYDEFLAFYKARLHVPEGVKPNSGHLRVAEWEASGYVTGVVTQNVDRLHQQAGSKKVAELHGSLEPVRCHACGRIHETKSFLDGEKCACGGRLRPGVVLFGEMLPDDQLDLAEEWTSESKTFIVLGSSLLVSPANYFPRKAKMHGASLVIVNRDATPLDSIADLVAHEEIGQYLERVHALM